ncbi:cysteine--tRNA ligase [Carnobacterium maltaromaticum]|uniref:cysteine--tRNA ligase n=1 Tax=Carnobacterium maltaromaticum TaxID=2751 RepID=UPI00070529FC|nr:cysteine--tRNA ligase [Carnobacterium maltaromaticum]KRN71135.1 cysteine--tRNA ligase [Carnobacterium maltaromaticum]MBC9810358.1 cysteine--tRNA ligase [Carnobacterium maltaromaticum]CRH19441.1 Cysteine--tRNA ligase [Carnobacterium maltaromaticum]CRH22850.1 Cysteine--tRNA ligase [Carnobacterium maltaromaticum]
MLKIYNTMTREKEVFVPLTEGQVKMYVCGPTVYNYIHIGNARSTVAFDTVRRYFEFRGYQVQFVSNFTDVDDKIIQAAKELNITAPDVADRFIEAFYTDVTALGVEKATKNPRVMENMPDIIEFIQVLIDKGYAYESDGDVYYRTRKFKNYGKLSDQSIDELEIGASNRLEKIENERKEDPVDFALWKSAKADEISWESPWGAGRPGWHIECSVLATKYLGDTIDIHGGGQDLTFPHHENEIAQSEAKTGHPFANYWMHNGFVTMDEEKMSKSLGNFVLVHELIKQVDPQVLRFFMATTHYRRPISYNEATISEAKNNLNKVQMAASNLHYRLSDATIELRTDQDYFQQLAEFKQTFITEMDDDFNAANGITVIYELAKVMNIYSEQAEVSKAVIEAMLGLFKELLQVFGITLENQAELLDENIEQLLSERTIARAEKNFAKSDEIRDLLKAEGIIIDDTPQGTRWRRE